MGTKSGSNLCVFLHMASEVETWPFLGYSKNSAKAAGKNNRSNLALRG